MDSSNNYPFYHIRVFRPPTYDASFTTFCTQHIDEYIITREGGGYDKKKHAFVRPHVHILANTRLKHTKLRTLFKKSFPSIAGNKDYSIHIQKTNNLLSYVLKDNKIIAKSSAFTDELIKKTPKWTTPAKSFRIKLFAHIDIKKYEYNKTHEMMYIPYGYRHFLHDTIRFCKDKEKWIPRSIIIRYAYILDIISADQYLDKIGLIPHPENRDR